MLRVALTGGIATGKSHILAQLAAFDIPTIDADALVHDLMKPGGAITSAVVARFGAGVQQPDGSVDRRRLGALVFADAAARRELEAIVHPAVYEAIASRLARLEAAGTHAFAVADVPLLYETGRAGEFDRVIVAACPPEMQVQRIVARDHLTEGDARQRLAAQWPIEQKVELADFVIRTDGTFEETNRRVREIVRVLEGEG